MPTRFVRLFFTISMVLLAMLANSLVAQNVVKTVTGEGTTRTEAIKSGLRDAILQALGGHIESVDTLSEEVLQTITDSKTTLEARNKSRQDIKTKTGGTIRTFEVLAERKVDAGIQVDLRVVVYRVDPKNPRDGDRPTLAVGEVAMRDDSPFSCPTLTKKQVCADLGKRIESRLYGSREFNSISREHVDALLREQERLGHEGMGNLEQAKLGLLLGADFLLQARISEFAIENRTAGLQNGSLTTESARARIEFEVINVASGESKSFSGNALGWTSVDLDRNKALGRRRMNAASPEDLLMDLLADALIEQIHGGFADAAWLQGKREDAPAKAASSPPDLSIDLFIQRMESRILERLDAIEKRLEAIEGRVGQANSNRPAASPSTRR